MKIDLITTREKSVFCETGFSLLRLKWEVLILCLLEQLIITDLLLFLFIYLSSFDLFRKLVIIDRERRREVEGAQREHKTERVSSCIASPLPRQ